LYKHTILAQHEFARARFPALPRKLLICPFSYQDPFLYTVRAQIDDMLGELGTWRRLGVLRAMNAAGFDVLRLSNTEFRRIDSRVLN